MTGRIPTRAGDIMSTPVITVPADRAIGDIATVLHKHRISAVPVVDDDGHVLGLVSEYDLLARSGRTAGDIMSTAVISISTGTSIADARRLLLDQRIGRLPVLADGRLAGIVSRGDVVALLATEWACGACGESARGEHPPGACPKCGAGSGRFSLQEQSPGP